MTNKCDTETCGTKSTLKCPSCSSDILCCQEHQQEYWNHRTTCSVSTGHVYLPPDPRFLFVFGQRNCRIVQYMYQLSFHDHKLFQCREVTEFNNKVFLSLLKSGQFSTCYFNSLSAVEVNSISEEVRLYMTAWVQCGGKLIIISDDEAMLTITNDWFQKDWSFSNCELIFARHSVCYVADNEQIIRSLKDNSINIGRKRVELPFNFQARIKPLLNVDMSERLYRPRETQEKSETDLCTVAMSLYGYGRIGFIGLRDIIGIQPLPELLLKLGGADRRYKRNGNWLRRRHFIKMLSGCQLWRLDHNKKEQQLTVTNNNKATLKVFGDVNMCKYIVQYL